MAYGEEFRHHLRGFLAYAIGPDIRKLRYARRCWEHLRRETPVSAQFIQGVAHASGLGLDRTVLLALHEELAHEIPKPTPHCTALVATGPATRGGQTIVAQNWDWTPAMYPWAGLVRFSIQGSPRVLTYHYPGLWNCCGINSHGLALMWTSAGVFPKVPPRVGVPTYAVIAEILRLATVSAALALVDRVRYAGPFMFFLGDAGGNTAVVEAIPGYKIVDRSGDALYRANYFLCPDMIRRSRQSEPRLGVDHDALRMQGMRRQIAQYRGRISVPVVKTMLSHPDVFSDNGTRMATLDRFVAVCQERALWTCRGGKPDNGPWWKIQV
jgi:hypothetical protein